MRLFEIERSLNSNVLRYDANITSHGLFSGVDPISAYWLMNAEDGHEEGLTWFEREHVYGFSVQMNPARTSLTMVIHALSSRPIFVSLIQGGVKAETEISGKSAILDKVFVKTGTGILHSVDWVELFGVDPDTGAPLRETLKP